MSNKPIAVFDSGVGGISVLKELYKLMPNENYIYFGDSANAPYGSREISEVKSLSVANTVMLMALGAKAVVIACNTATSVAAASLRDKYKEFPIIGIEPALKPAVLSKENSTVAVLATPITLREEKFKKLMASFEDRAKIIPVPAEKLAGMIEKGILSGKELEDYIRSLFASLGKIDSVVLGCTHYPFVKDSIIKVLGDVSVFDGGEGTAKETRRRLSELDLINKSEQKGEIVFLSSSEDDSEIELYKKLFNMQVI